MRVLVAGCGYVGTALGLALAADGHTVFGLRRRAAALPAPLVPVSADLTDAASLAGLPADLDAVVYAAAAGGRSEAAYRVAYVDGLGNLLEALAAAARPPRRVLFTSSTSVYGQEDGSWVDEGSPTEPRGFTGRLVLEGEGCVAAGPIPGVVLRLGGIYGPGRTRLLESVRRGEARATPGWTNRIHRDDAAGALRHLLGVADPAPLYVGVDCEPAERPAVLAWLAERLGVAAPPREPASAGGGGRGGSKRCRNARLLASGYAFRYPTFREGYAALLEEQA